MAILPFARARRGDKSKEHKDEPVGDQDHCPHDHIHHRGSTASNKVYFCTDCGKTLDIPSAEYVARKSTAKGAERAHDAVRLVVDRALQDPTLDTEEARSAITIFRRSAD